MTISPYRELTARSENCYQELNALADLAGVPGARPLWDLILSFSHIFSPKSAHIRGPCSSPHNGSTPPYGKSWIRHCNVFVPLVRQGRFQCSVIWYKTASPLSTGTIIPIKFVIVCDEEIMTNDGNELLVY